MTGQARGGGTGGRSERRCSEARYAGKLSSPVDGYMKVAAELATTASPRVQRGQHCLSGSGFGESCSQSCPLDSAFILAQQWAGAALAGGVRAGRVVLAREAITRQARSRRANPTGQPYSALDEPSRSSRLRRRKSNAGVTSVRWNRRKKNRPIRTISLVKLLVRPGQRVWFSRDLRCRATRVTSALPAIR
jgi:hypothetical protein